METFPKELKAIIQAYMKPSEILAELSSGEQEMLLSNAKEAWEFWGKQARNAFGVSQEKFITTSFSPYKRYLDFFAHAGGVDYGCEYVFDIITHMRRAAKEGNIPLLTYFYETIEGKEIGDIMPDLSAAFGHRTTTDVLTNDFCMSEEAGCAPNFPQVLAFLIGKGLNKRGVNIAWLIHSLEHGDYEIASNLIRKTKKRAEEQSFANIALDYAVETNNVSLARKLLADFDIEDPKQYLECAVITDNPELVHLIANACHAQKEEILSIAKEHGERNVIAFYS